MKAAQLYAYDKEIERRNLKLKTVPEPTISDPEDVIVSCRGCRLVPDRSACHRRGMAGRDGCGGARCCPTSWDMKNAGWVIDGSLARRKWREKCTMMCGYRFLIP